MIEIGAKQILLGLLDKLSLSVEEDAKLIQSIYCGLFYISKRGINIDKHKGRGCGD